MHYSVQFFTWTRTLGLHQVGRTVEIDALSPKAAAVTLLGLRLDESGTSRNLAARVWRAANAQQSDCDCFYYH